MSPETTADRPPAETPWGQTLTAIELHPGIWHVTTPRHGGIWLAPWRGHQFRDALPGVARSQWLRDENGDSALIALVWPEELDIATVHSAVQRLGAMICHADRVTRNSPERLQRARAIAAANANAA